METLAERLADKNKVELYPGFVAALNQIAMNEYIDVDTIWMLWKQYTEECRNMDQSPVMSEFCYWNKFQNVQVN